jgi:hypothetical protein
MDAIRFWTGSVDLIVTGVALLLFLGALLTGRLSLRRFPWRNRRGE